MKRILALLLCLAMALSVSACKPDNITYPSDITPGDAQQTQDPAPEQTKEPTEPGDEASQQPDSSPEQETPPAPAEPEEGTASKEPAGNPLAAEGFKSASGIASALPLSGLTKTNSADSALKDRTVTFYTANDQPAFSYINETGKQVTEWDWLTALAEEKGFNVKYSIKSSAVSIKSQRVALFAGKKLGLLQISADSLADGLALSRSAADLIDMEVSTFGISKTVLKQSAQKLFAPVGNVNALWYNTALIPADADPQTLSKTNKWTVAQFNAVCAAAAEKKAMPLKMSESLAWATLGEKNPLTLEGGKLSVSGLNIQELQPIAKEIAAASAFTQENNVEYSLQSDNISMSYDAVPAAAKNLTLKYAPLPALKEGEPGTVTFTGAFFALPKYESDAAALKAGLELLELWCNRYTEAISGRLQELKISGSAYQEYCDFAETQGVLILRSREIEEALQPTLSGLNDEKVDMAAAYEAASDRINALLTTKNLYY